jgi:recombinational DNA repair protein RecR
MLDDERVLETIGMQKAQQVITKLVQIASREYDCNSGEILEGHTDRLHLCYYCLTIATDLESGLCRNCR